jgi:hypothetical protein
LILLRVEEAGRGPRGLRFIGGAIFGGVGHDFLYLLGIARQATVDLL